MSESRPIALEAASRLQSSHLFLPRRPHPPFTHSSSHLLLGQDGHHHSRHPQTSVSTSQSSFTPRSLTCTSPRSVRPTEFDDAVSTASGLVVVDFHAQWWLVSAHSSARGQMKREGCRTREGGAELFAEVADHVVLSLALLLLWLWFRSGTVDLGESF